MKEALRLLRNKNFVLLWISQIVDQLTVNIISFMIITRLFEQTGSTIATSFVWIAYALPAIIVGPIGAVAADMFNRKKLLVTGNFIQSMVLLVYALFFKDYGFLAYALVFIYSFFNQFYIPSEAASLPMVVDKKHLPVANGLMFLTVQISVALGFVLAGILYDSVGFGNTIFAASFGLFIAFLSVSFLPQLNSGDHLPKDFDRGVGKFFHELGDGVRLLRRNKRILVPFLLLIGLQVALSIMVVNLPIVSSEIVKVTPRFSGLVVILPAAFGALTATFIIPRLLIERFRKRKMVEGAVFTLCCALLILVFLTPILPFWMGRTLAILCFLAAGAGYVGGLIPSMTYLQEVTPKDMTGRVFGNIWFITTVATVIPVLFSATITEIFGVKPMIFILSTMGIMGIFLARKFVSDAYINRPAKSIE